MFFSLQGNVDHTDIVATATEKTIVHRFSNEEFLKLAQSDEMFAFQLMQVRIFRVDNHIDVAGTGVCVGGVAIRGQICSRSTWSKKVAFSDCNHGIYRAVGPLL